MPSCFTAAKPVQAGTGASSEILSKGLTCQQLLNRLIAQAATMVAQANKRGRASAKASLKRPPSSLPDGPAKRSHTSSPA